MTLRISIARRAEEDLTHHYRWYLNTSLDLAERFLTSFHATVYLLSEHPGLGPRRRFRAPELAGIRSFPVERPFRVHLVFYRANDKFLSIERVIHGARDLPDRLLEPSG